MIRLKRNLCATLACALLFFVNACTPAVDKPMNLASIDWLGYAPLYLAEKLAYMKPEKIHLIELTSASEVMRNFRNGTVDAATLTLDEALVLKSEGFDLQIVLVMDISHGSDVIIAQKTIKTMSELVGKRVGLEKTALGAYMLNRALDLSGLSADDIKTTSLEFSEHEHAFLTGEIDAVVTFGSAYSRLNNAGGNVVFSSKEIPGEIVDVLVIRDSYLKEHRDNVTHALKVWFQSLAYLQQNYAAAVQTLASSVSLKPDEYRKSLEGLRFPDYHENMILLSASDEASMQMGLSTLKETMLHAGLLDKDVDTRHFYSDQFLLLVK